MNHYTLEFIFEKRFWDSEFDVNYTDGRADSYVATGNWIIKEL